MPASTQDVTKPFDPTGYATITGAQLGQLVDGIGPYADKGIVVSTTDVAGVPDVPNAAVTTKWKTYIWRRVMVSSVVAYLWNDAAASDATYLKWQTVASAALADASVTNAKLGPAAVTDDKVTSISWSKITGAPVALAPTGAAGGDLTGTYPNPTVAANAIDNTKLKSDAVTSANRAVTADHIRDNVVTVGTPGKLSLGTALQMLRTNAAATGSEWASIKITEVADPVAGDAFKVVRVKSDESGFEKASLTGVPIQIVAKACTAYDSTATTIPVDDSIPQITEGKEYVTLAFTPLSASSKLRIRFNCFTGVGGPLIVALFRDAVTNADAAIISGADGMYDTVCLEHVMASPGTSAITFRIRFGTTSGTTYINGNNTNHLFGVAGNTFFTVEEFFGTLS